MATTNLNIRVDEDLKKSAEAVFTELGMNLSTAMNIFLRQAVRYGGIPFDLRVEKPSAETLQAMEDVNNHRNLSRSFGSIQALMEDLNA